MQPCLHMFVHFIKQLVPAKFLLGGCHIVNRTIDKHPMTNSCRRYELSLDLKDIFRTYRVLPYVLNYEKL